MILTLLRQEYSRLVKAYLESTKEEHEKQPSIWSCTARLIQLCKWLTNNGKESVQITRQEIYKKVMGKHGKDAIAAHVGLEVTR